MIDLYNGDCLDVMDKLIEQGIIVDSIITDIPYGTTACKWDTIIPFDKMWERLNKITKPNGAIVLFGSEPFSSTLRMSNIKNFKYDLYWQKEKPTNFFQLKKRFGKTTEVISIFYKKQTTYNPQKYKVNYIVKNKTNKRHNSIVSGIGKKITEYKDDGTRYPIDILKFNRVKLGKSLHPTQKPIALMEYLIRTYTNENETVLDFTMGSGSTAIACMNTNRNFIGIELDEQYFSIAQKRVDEKN